jgi:hypothetical protein
MPAFPRQTKLPSHTGVSKTVIISNTFSVLQGKLSDFETQLVHYRLRSRGVGPDFRVLDG